MNASFYDGLVLSVNPLIKYVPIDYEFKYRQKIL